MSGEVLFVTFGDEQTASTRYRVLNYRPYFNDAGLSYRVDLNRDRVFTSNWYVDKAYYAMKLLRAARKYDIVYIQKVLLPEPLVRALSRLTTVLYDFDDAVYAAPPWEDEDDVDPPELFERTLGLVDGVVTGNPRLTKYAEEFATQVHSIPTPIPRDRCVKALEQAGEDDSDHVTIGWIGNPENLWYLRRVHDPVTTVLDRYEEAELQIVTSADREYTPFADRIGTDVFYREWSLDEELNHLREFDIAIRPLTHDEWSSAKGGFTSVIQCMGMRTPVVVTPVEMLRDIVAHGEAGFHADGDEEWVEYLSRLVVDPLLREELSANAFDAVGAQEFWTEQRQTEFVGTLQRYL
ncbi:glycosyltransferase [Haloglomus salinum]|uniref:glycosyltransferase n=1 Tax=Haloglomus salinum TaxID=2962673 RepID=UPI0020CA1738|nr:glycosyltransferase [Haloglomus salinum]